MSSSIAEFGSLQIERQQFSNWCWAASTQYICSWFDQGFSLSQAQIVADVLGQASCAFNPNNSFCNQTRDFSEALNFFGHLDREIDDILSAEQLEGQFQRISAPIGCQMELPGIGGHAVVITDVQKSSLGLFLAVADPGDGSMLTMRYEIFRANYRGNGGAWIRTYLTT
jgi:hypothetical protein